MNEAARLFSSRRAAHKEAIAAESAIDSMGETNANQYVVLSALHQHFAAGRSCDYSMVLKHLDEAMVALAETYAYTQEDLNEFCRERMEE